MIIGMHQEQTCMLADQLNQILWDANVAVTPPPHEYVLKKIKKKEHCYQIQCPECPIKMSYTSKSHGRNAFLKHVKREHPGLTIDGSYYNAIATPPSSVIRFTFQCPFCAYHIDQKGKYERRYSLKMNFSSHLKHKHPAISSPHDVQLEFYECVPDEELITLEPIEQNKKKLFCFACSSYSTPQDAQAIARVRKHYALKHAALYTFIKQKYFSFAHYYRNEKETKLAEQDPTVST